MADTNIQDRMKAYRFFELSGKGTTGDRFLQPWLYCHVFATGPRGRGAVKQARKELERFFNQKDLVAILDDAGEDREALLESQLIDSAEKYLTISRDDDGFGRKLFGLLRMKQPEKEDRIIGDVYRSMIPLLAALDSIPQSRMMILALDRACRGLYPQRLQDMEAAVVATLGDEYLSLLPDFVPGNPEDDGSSPGH